MKIVNFIVVLIVGLLISSPVLALDIGDYNYDYENVVALGWENTKTRTDGTAFTDAEVGKFQIFHASPLSSEPEIIDIDKAARTHQVVGLAPGDHVFSLRVCDLAGTCGVWGETVTANVRAAPGPPIEIRLDLSLVLKIGGQ